MEFLAEVIEAVNTLAKKGMIKLLSPEQSSLILDRIRNEFISGNPTYLWHSFSKPYMQLESKGNEDIKRALKKYFHSKQVYLLLEDDSYFIILINSDLILDFLYECRYVVYYVIDVDFKNMLCENDHNQLIYIENKL